MNAHVQLGEIARIAEQLSVLCDDDEQLFHDMLQGESDIDRIVSRIHEQIARDQEMLIGIKAREESLKERKQRINDRVEAAKAAIGKFLRAGQLAKLELPEVTYSVRDGKPTLRVLDPAAVPTEYQRVKSEPDKPAINAAFAEAETLPNWLTRDPARDVVSARTK
ncbi:siphovirus Gp157 family protein [Novosphingobium sp. JCM 18896]|uniref:siphovirus Gp157 family protein n=1 Tax=Novosphingobium sp. JCM 18896 TaxID=2989731 RepID=UPI0022223F15|nr:siphovirus Gp157 family protein [Novosphingobium sp. JCM 18896]MCW1431367.1 siphovirus Gp157 family protein [Novosphingobium sp. JCM 18896]